MVDHLDFWITNGCRYFVAGYRHYLAQNWSSMSGRRLLSNLLSAAIGISLAVAIGLLLDRREPITLYSEFSSIQPNPATPGVTIAITWKAKAERQCAGSVIPRIVDSTGRIYEYTPIPTVYHDLMNYNPGTFTKTLQLPEVIAPGLARYEAVVTRWCNSMQQHFWPMVDKPFPIPFTVAPKD